ncbi:hypothetical protein VU08_07335 [Desulfobulbus sp. F5]|nr:hypothetical protein [Desulfobulbus sp. F5]
MHNTKEHTQQKRTYWASKDNYCGDIADYCFLHAHIGVDTVSCVDEGYAGCEARARLPRLLSPQLLPAAQSAESLELAESGAVPDSAR